jgi:RNA-binding protein YlmH
MSEQNLLIEISKNLATNTEATKNIEKHLVQLNGKVASQESFTRTLKTAVDLQAVTLDGLVTREANGVERRRKLAWLTIDNIFKFVFGAAMTYLLYKAGL